VDGLTQCDIYCIENMIMLQVECK